MTSEIMFTHVTASAKIEIKSSLQQCMLLDGECHRYVYFITNTLRHLIMKTHEAKDHEQILSEDPEFQIINLKLLHPAVIWCTLSSVQAVSS